MDLLPKPIALMDGHVLNRNWRGLPESSQLVDGTSAGPVRIQIEISDDESQVLR